MKDLFYIVEVRPQWYNLLLKDTHYCITCGSDLEAMKKVVYDYVRKFKTPDKVYRLVSGFSDHGLISPATFEKREEDFGDGRHHSFISMIHEVVERAIKDNRFDTPYHQTKKRVVEITPVEHTNTPFTVTKENSVRKITPIRIKKTPIFPTN